MCNSMEKEERRHTDELFVLMARTALIWGAFFLVTLHTKIHFESGFMDPAFGRRELFVAR